MEFNVVKEVLSVHVLKLGNKKVTKSVFMQIHQENYDSKKVFKKISESEIMGYVNTDGYRYLIWFDEGKVRKTRLDSGRPYHLVTNPTKEMIEADKIHDLIWDALDNEIPQVFISI